MEKNGSGALPLSGMTVLLTRAAHQAGKLSLRLRALGAEVIEMPLIEIAPPLSWHDLDQALETIDTFDWIFFASSNAAQSLLDRSENILGQKALGTGRSRLAAIGPSTAKYLKGRGLNVDYIPPKFVAESFVDSFPGYPNLRGQKILWPRTDIGRNYIFEKLTEAGAEVSLVEAYRTIMPKDAPAIADRLVELLHLRKVEVITFTSGQTARNFAQVLDLGKKKADRSSLTGAGEENSRFSKLLQDVTLVSIGPETTKAIGDCGLPVCLEAKSHDAEGLIEAILRQFQRA
jgi:uroporphyrinogen-III synthase